MNRILEIDVQKHSVLPVELEILSVLPEVEQRMVFELASQQTYCQNLDEWLRYLEQYVQYRR